MADEDTGEVISIVRNEIIVERGTILDQETVDRILDANVASILLQRDDAKVSDFGKQLATDIKKSLLEDMNDWWGAEVSLEAAGKTLEGNEKIHSKLNVISARILDFLEKENLQKIEVVYHTPARFIDGKYPPGMIEKYWAQLADLRAAEEERAILDREARKARLAQRWDSL